MRRSMGFFAALTRSVGVMLVFPFGVQVLLDALHEGGGAREIIWRIVRRGWKVILIPLGTVVYLLINYAVFGDALHFLVAQREHWSAGNVLYRLYPARAYKLRVHPGYSPGSGTVPARADCHFCGAGCCWGRRAGKTA